MDPVTLKIDFNLDSLRAYVQAEIRKVVDLTSFGLAGAAEFSPTSLEIPASPFQLREGSGSAMISPDFRNEARQWALRSGFRELVEAVGLVLEEIHRLASYVAPFGRQGLTYGEFVEGVEHGRASFHWMSAKQRIEFLSTEYGIGAPSRLSQGFLSVNWARNCFVHRAGIVGEKDLNSSGRLSVRWVRADLLTTKDGKTEALEIPAEVSGGTEVSLRWGDAVREFSQGELVEFSNREFAEIAWSLIMFSLELVAAFDRYLRAKGVRIVSPPNAVPSDAAPPPNDRPE